MSNAQKRNNSNADEIARLRKQLSKNVAHKVNPGVIHQTTLVPKKDLGPCSVVQVVGQDTVHQFVVCRPIGCTDLNAKEDWVMIPSSQVSAALARRKDPNVGEYNQLKARMRTQMAVSEGLLVEVATADGSGASQHYYPHNMENSRNQCLNLARQALKTAVGRLKEQIQSTTDEAVKNQLKSDLGNRTDPVQFLTGPDRTAELKLREFFKSAAVLGELDKIKSPYRTLVGQYGDQPQAKIFGASNRSLQEVTDALSKMISEIDVSPFFSFHPETGARGTEGTQVEHSAVASQGSKSLRQQAFQAVGLSSAKKGEDLEDGKSIKSSKSKKKGKKP